jgi:hypothetical protein
MVKGILISPPFFNFERSSPSGKLLTCSALYAIRGYNNRMQSGRMGNRLPFATAPQLFKLI